MLLYGIEQFVGSWVSASGYCLRIKKVRKDLASVDFPDPRGAPVQRPYMGGAPSTNMIAHYDDYYENFEVELCEERKLILHLSHEYDYELDLLGINPFEMQDVPLFLDFPAIFNEYR